MNLMTAFDRHPSFLEAEAAAGAFLAAVARYQGTGYFSQDTIVRCALAEVWRQGRIYERDRDTAALLALSRREEVQ